MDCLCDHVWKWEINGYRNAKGQQVAHSSSIHDFHHLIEEAKDDGFLIKFWHVRREYNESADRLANMALEFPNLWSLPEKECRPDVQWEAPLNYYIPDPDVQQKLRPVVQTKAFELPVERDNTWASSAIRHLIRRLIVYHGTAQNLEPSDMKTYFGPQWERVVIDERRLLVEERRRLLMGTEEDRCEDKLGRVGRLLEKLEDCKFLAFFGPAYSFY